MLSFSLFRLINTLLSGFVRKRSHTIWLIDEIPTSILSLLSNRSGNIQLIDKCRFFTLDLHRFSYEKHEMHYQRDIVQPPRTYYRGTILFTEDLKKLIVGNLITFNSFISTSSSREVAMIFVDNALIEIEINNRTGLHAIFHPVSDVSHFKNEEVLFSIGNVFRVEQISWCTKKSIWQVKLVLQKHLIYRSNFEMKSSNNTNRNFVNRIWENVIQPSIQMFKGLLP